jgi:hypothetical protein
MEIQFGPGGWANGHMADQLQIGGCQLKYKSFPKVAGSPEVVLNQGILHDTS